MQKKKKYAILICCILLVAFTLSLLPGEVLGKYIKVFDEIGAIVVPKNYYTITIVDNYDPKEEIRVLIDYEEGYTLSGAIETYLTETEIDGRTFQYWVYAGGGTVDSNKDDGSIDHTIPAGHTTDVVIYPKWADEYWLRFLDGLGNDEENVLFAHKITSTTPNDVGADKVSTALATAQSRYDALYGAGIYVVTGWDKDYTDENLYGNADVIITAVSGPAAYDGTLTFTGVDKDGDGVPDTYYTSGVDKEGTVHVEIPEYYNGEKVTSVGANTFAGFNNLEAVKLPESIESIGANAFEDGPNQYVTTSGRSTITFYYEGNRDTFRGYMDYFYRTNAKYNQYNNGGFAPTFGEDATTIFEPSWDSGLGDGSRIFFIDENGDVIQEGYWELYHISEGGLLGIGATHYYIWIYHDHAYDNANGCSTNTSGEHTDYLAQNENTGEYTRIDKEYWLKEDGTEIV